MLLALLLFISIPSLSFGYQCPDLTGEFLCAGGKYANDGKFLNIAYGVDGEFNVKGKAKLGLGFVFKTERLESATKYTTWGQGSPTGSEFVVPTLNVQEKIEESKSNEGTSDVTTSVVSCHNNSLTSEMTTRDYSLGGYGASQVWRPFRHVHRTTLKIKKDGNLFVVNTEPKLVKVDGLLVEQTELTKLTCKRIPGLFLSPTNQGN